MRKTVYIEPRLFELVESLRKRESPIPSFSGMLSRLAYRGSIGYAQPIIPQELEFKIEFCDRCGSKIDGRYCWKCGALIPSLTSS